MGSNQVKQQSDPQILDSKQANEKNDTEINCGDEIPTDLIFVQDVFEEQRFDSRPISSSNSKENNIRINENKNLESKNKQKNKNVKEDIQIKGANDYRDAIRKDSYENALFFIKNETDFLKKNKFAFHYAVEHGNLPIIKYFVDTLGQNIEEKEPECNLTPLHLAIIHGYLDIAEYLIIKGANIEAESKTKDRPLHHASFHGHENVTSYLINQGANLFAKNSNGKIPEDESRNQRIRNIFMNHKL